MVLTNYLNGSNYINFYKLLFFTKKQITKYKVKEIK